MTDNLGRTPTDARRDTHVSPLSTIDKLSIVGLLVVCLAAFALDTLLMRGMTERLHGNDFGKFYYSARAFLGGGDMYAPSPATDLRFPEAPALQFLNMNPPHFHVLVLPFAALSLSKAAALWMAVSGCALVAALILIAREIDLAWTPKRLLILVAGTLAFAGTQAFFATGQLVMLLLLALTLAWLAARRGRWHGAAVWLGVCLSVKPFLLIFVPYLAATRRFRALLVLLGTAAICYSAGLLVFGIDAYQSWYRAVAQSGDWTWLVMNASTLGFFRRSFDVQPIVTPLVVRPGCVTLWVLPAGMLVAVTLAAAISDKTRGATDRAFGLLLVAAQLMSPLGWIYYLWLPAGPVAVLARSPQPPNVRRQNIVFAIIAAVGFCWPIPFLPAFQPHRWATLAIASIYFWATLALWSWMVLD